MTIDVRANQPARRPAATPAALPTAAAAPAAKTPAAPAPAARVSAKADAAIAQGLGTGNLQPLDALLTSAAAAAKAATSAGRVATAVKQGRIQRFLDGALRFLTPSPAQIAQVARVIDTVRKNVWERGLDKLARIMGMDDMSADIKVLADPPDVNAPNAAADAQAKRELADPRLRAATQAALAKLSPADRKTYDQLFAKLQGQPRAQAGLQALARADKLGAKDLAGGQNLLTHLGAIATQPLAPSVQQAGQTALLAQVVLELAEPGAIAQKGVNSCGATVVQHMIARDHPGEYARLVAGLASPAGAVTMQDGQTLRRDPAWNADSDVSKRFGGVRSISSRLLQPAFLHHAGTFRYDNQRDGSIIPVLDMAVMGMVPWGMTKLIKGLTGRSFDWDVATRSSTFERRMKSASPERPVPIALNYAERRGEIGPHWVQVVGFDAGSNRIIALNPWGRKETIPLDVAERHLLAVVHPE